jgi:Type I phosphodiesterase / nucleotide pyrophosphatase
MTNAVVGGVLVAMYLVVLVLQLNPQVSVVSITAWRWFLALLMFYGTYLSVAMFLLLLAREALVVQPQKPAWLSVRLLAWLGAGGAMLAAAATWANLRGFRAVLSDGAADRMRAGALATSICAALLLTIAILRYSFGRRGSRATGVFFIVVMVVSIVVPLWRRGPVELPLPAAKRQVLARQAPVTPRVRVIALDGASLDFIRTRVAAGRLPNFGNLLDRGAEMDLATLKPTQAAPVWAAAATGKYPPKTGVRSNSRYRVQPDDPEAVDLLPDYCFANALVLQGFVTAEELVTADGLDARPFWDILTDYGLVSGVVDWPMTEPARATLGFVVTDRFDEATNSPFRLADAGRADPTTAASVARGVFDDWQNRQWTDVLPAATPGEAEPGGLMPARWDLAYADAARELERQFNPRLMMLRFEGLDALGHAYLDRAQPELFGELRSEDAQRSPLDRYYGVVDAEVGRAVAQLEPGDLLLVVSGFGMTGTAPAKRLLARLLGRSDPSGTHEPAPDGFLLAAGTNVAHGQVRRGAIVDLAPTVLYYLGLDVGRDMDGFARTDLFLRSFTVERPVSYVLTHEK